MDAAFWPSIVSAVTGICIAIITAVSAYALLALRLRVEAVHTLVNSDKGRLLKIVALTLRRVASESKLPADLEAADLAETALAHHQRQQAALDDFESRKES